MLFPDSRFSSMDLVNLRHCLEAMRFAVIILECSPQTYQLTLLTITGFQRSYLEVLACYEYLTIFKDKPFSEHPEVDTTLMGTVTFSLEVAQYMYSKGVPVWLVRSPHEFAPSTPIWAAAIPRMPSEALRPAMNFSQPVFKGEASAVRNRACQAIRVGNVRHGHRAYGMVPGDFSLEHCIRGMFFGISLPISLLMFCQFRM